MALFLSLLGLKATALPSAVATADTIITTPMETGATAPGAAVVYVHALHLFCVIHFSSWF